MRFPTEIVARAKVSLNLTFENKHSELGLLHEAVVQGRGLALRFRGHHGLHRHHEGEAQQGYLAHCLEHLVGERHRH